MENLKYPTMRYLITNLTVKDFGYFLETDPDTSTARRHLLLKKFGEDIVYADVTSIKATKTKAGSYKSVLLKTNAPAPCDDCHYEFGINILRIRQQPGVQNDDYYPKNRFYGGVIEAIQTPSGGQLADSDKLYMEDTIMADIHSDQDTNTREPGIVHAKRLYIITTNLAATDVISFIVNGVSTNQTLTNGATTAGAVSDLNGNTTFDDNLVAFAISATQIAITSINPEVPFTITDGGGAAAVIYDRYLWIYAKYTDIKFEIQFEHGVFTLSRFNLLVLQNLAASAGNLVVGINGTTYTSASSATSSTFAASIIAQISAVGYATATKSAGSVPIYIYTGIYDAHVKTLGTAGISILTQYSGGGQWPALTWQEVFNIFAFKENLGRVSPYVNLNQVSPDTLFNKITIVCEYNTAALDGASHRDTYRRIIEIYLAEGFIATNLWHDPATTPAASGMWESVLDDASFSATKTLVQLLDYWANAGTLSLGLL